MPSPERSPAYRAGVVASLGGEAVFILMVAMVSLLRGMDPWMVARVPGSFVLGPSAVQPPGFVPGDVLIGLLMHLWLGILVGVTYAALLPRLRISPVMGGLIAAAVLYALGFWTLPLLFPRWLAPFWLPPTDRLLQAVAHAVYGWVFGYAYMRLVPGRVGTFTEPSTGAAR
jgi:hypothetical protein